MHEWNGCAEWLNGLKTDSTLDTSIKYTVLRSSALVDVSVTQFAVARARKHNQQDTELEGPQAGTYPMLTMVFATSSSPDLYVNKQTSTDDCRKP